MAAKKKPKVRPKKGATKRAPVVEPGKVQRLRSIADQCNKALGKTGAVYFGNEQRPYERDSTGIVALDYVLGGGLVRGQMTQFTGGDSSFKSTAAIICAAACQARGGTAAWVAGEGFDKDWAAKWGVDLDELVMITADMGDTAMEAAMTLLQTNLINIMVFDSVQSLGTTREMEGGVDDESYAGAGAPQMWGRVMRKTYSAMNSGCDAALIAISQVRSAIGKFSRNGPPEPEGSGIWALKHWKCADVYFRKGELDFIGEANEKRKINGREFKLRGLKNKTAVSERHASFKLVYDEVGPMVENVGTLFRLAQAYDLIETKGAWYSGYGIRANGKDAFKEALDDAPDAQEEIMADLRDVL